MRYLPLSDADRGEMLARIGVADIDELFADVPADKRLRGPRSTCRAARARSRSSASSAAWPRRTSPAGSVPFFVGAGAYKHHVPATRRSPDPALRVPDQLHALSARDRAGHAAISVRVPDPGRATLTGMEVANASMYDGSTGDRRGGADGAPRHQAPQGGALRRPAPALSPRWCETLSAHGRATTVVALPPDAAGDRGPARRNRRQTCPASSCRRPTSSAICATCAAIADKAHAARRAAHRRVHRGRLARPRHAAGRAWAPTSSSARASRSATR